MSSKTFKEVLPKLLQTNVHYHVLAYGFLFVFSLLRVPLIARYLSAEELGSYSLYTSFLSYVDIIFFSWLLSTGWRFVYDSKKIQSIGHLVAGIAPLFVGLCLASTMFALLVAKFFFKPYDAALLLLGLGLIISQQMVSFYLFFLHSSASLKKWCFYTCLYHLSSFLLLMLLLTVLGMGIASTFAAFLVCNLLLLLLVAVKNLRHLLLFKKKVARRCI